MDRNANAPLRPVLEQVIAEIQSVNPARVIQTRIEFDENIDCDRVRMGQMLSNLLSNAVTHGAKDQPINVLASTQSGTFALEVANGGPPIEEAARLKLFQPFFRGEINPNKTGLGLGLHIASEIAKAHGGHIAVTSNHEATRFRFEMPLTSVTS